MSLHSGSQFVYDPHIKPAVIEWWEVQKARRQARRARRQGPVAPHSYSDDQDMRQRPTGDDGETLVELESLRPISKSSSVQSAVTSSDIRLRRGRPVSDVPSKMLDEVRSRLLWCIKLLLSTHSCSAVCWGAPLCTYTASSGLTLE